MESRVTSNILEKKPILYTFIIKNEPFFFVIMQYYKVYIYEINTTQSSHRNTNRERSSFTGGSASY